MKFNCGPTWIEKHAAQKEWHDFFSILPRQVASGDCRWLETIERKGTFTRSMIFIGYHDPWRWEYRAKEES